MEVVFRLCSTEGCCWNYDIEVSGDAQNNYPMASELGSLPWLNQWRGKLPHPTMCGEFWRNHSSAGGHHHVTYVCQADLANSRVLISDNPAFADT